MTPEHKAKISAALKGKRKPQSMRDRLSAANKGKKHSEETIAKIKKNRSGIPAWNKGKKGKIPWNKGMVGYMAGEKNGMYVDGLSNSSGVGRKEKIAGRERAERCEICYRKALTDFDHDHATGEFRGWLCRRCNLTLGMAKDSPELLRRLAHYLEIKEMSMTKNILDTLFPL